MGTKLFKYGDANDVTEFVPPHTGAEPPAGIQPFLFRQVSSDPTAPESAAGLDPTGEVANCPDPGDAGQASEAPPEPEIDVEGIQREAFQQGFAEGEKAGSDTATARFQDSVAAFGQAARELAALKPALRIEAETELVTLALTIARRIIRRELSVDPTTVRALVRSCYDEFQRAEIHRIRVNPNDIEAVAAYFEDNPAPTIQLHADPSISPGGAVFESAQGELDGRIETQLNEIEYGLADR